MKVYVLTYNTADYPERRIIEGVYSTREKAVEQKNKVLKVFEEFCIDTEISEQEVK